MPQLPSRKNAANGLPRPLREPLPERRAGDTQLIDNRPGSSREASRHRAGRDEKGLDDKVLCVPCEDPNWDHVQRLEDLAQPLRDEIAHFFSICKKPEGHHVTVDGWFPREEALAVIEASRDRRRHQRA